MDEPKIKVGICDGYPEVRGRLNGVYRAGGSSFTGEFVCRPLGGAVVLSDAFGRELLRGPEIRLTAERSGTFTLHEVTIGVRFHWERREEQTFPGDLTFLPAGEGVLDRRQRTPRGGVPGQRRLVGDERRGAVCLSQGPRHRLAELARGDAGTPRGHTGKGGQSGTR